jgi:hypothetical protein
MLVVSLYVAAGGGGDAVTAALVRRALGDHSPAAIATYGWDRLSVDPVPGPRGAADFTGLRKLGARAHAVVAGTAPRPPSGSTLPRLAADLADLAGDTLVLLDPTGGVAGLAALLAEAADHVAADTVTVVDVGGDAVARGDEPGLRSPLADGLALAAAAKLGLPGTVVVAGPGLDGELGEAEVLAITGPSPARRLDEADVAPFRRVFSWHPSEATALLVAAARGLRGRVLIRDAGLDVDLTDASPGVHVLPLADAVAGNRLAGALGDTTSLAEVEEVTRAVCGLSEIDTERRKAARRAAAPPAPRPTPPELDVLVAGIEADAVERGAHYLTFRRIAEATGLPPGAVAGLRAHLLASRPDRYRWPLWSLAPA